MNDVINVVSSILILSALISLGVSLVTEFVIKKLFTMSTAVMNYFVTIFSIVATFIVAMAYIQITGYVTTWYVWIAILFLGFIVAGISMSGYDKVFSYVFSWINGIFNKGDKS